MKDRVVKLETMIITKDAWVFLKQQQRKKLNCTPISNERIEEQFNRIKKRRLDNQGASNEDYPLSENEIRITNSSFCFNLKDVKTLLEMFGYEYRADGFVQEALNLYI